MFLQEMPVDLLQLYFIFPRIVDIALFLICIITAFFRYPKIKWKDQPIFFKLIVTGMAGWVIFMSLTLIFLLIAPISLPIDGVREYYSGYDVHYPSLFIANILRDIAALGFFFLLFSYCIMGFIYKYGEQKVKNFILKWKIIWIILIIYIGITIYFDRISVEIIDGVYISDVEWIGLSGAAVFLAILFYCISTVIIFISINSSKMQFFYLRNKKEIQNLMIGNLLMAIGYISFNLFGILKSLNPALFSQLSTRIITTGIGYFFWIISPIFTFKGLSLPLEEIDPTTKSFQNLISNRFSEFLIERVIGIFMILDKKIIYCNDICLDIFEMSSEEILNKPVNDLFARINAEDRKNVVNSIFQVNNNQYLSPEIAQVTFGIKSNRSQLKWARLYFERINFRQNDIIHCSFFEITDEVILSQKFHASQNQMNVLIDHSVSLIYKFDIVHGHYEFLSPSSNEILGYTHREMMKMSLEDMLMKIHPEDRKQFLNSSKRYPDKYYEYPLILEFRFNNKKIGYRWVRDSRKYIYDENKNPIWIYGNVVDITDQKKSADSIIRNQKLESLGLLAGGIAHDFNNILSTMMMNIDFLHLSEKNDQNMEILSDLKAAVNNATQLTKQLLTFSKGGSPIKKPHYLYSILQDNISLVMRGSINRFDFLEFDRTILAEVDAGQLSQVINNILINANQAMSDGGLIEVKLSQSHLKLLNTDKFSDKKFALISIRDHGQGISKEDQEKIFTPYFTTKSSGTGLGLATSYSIIKNHGGEIRFHSVTGVGTEFQIYLPIYDGPIPISPQKKKKNLHYSAKILAMDDNNAIQKYLKKILEKLGAFVDIASTGEEAIELYKISLVEEKKYDLVLLDLTIPEGMGGKETLNQLKLLDPTVRAIVASGYSNDQVISNYKKYGFIGTLNKPFGIKEIQELFNKFL